MEQTNSKDKIISLFKDPVFDRVLVACHRSPDGDAIGSAHALVWALRKMGKCARVFCPDPFPEKFDYITHPAVSEDFDPEHFVTVDVAASDMLCDAPFLDRIDVVIDHHRINSVQAPVKLVLPEVASCGEICLDLIREMKVPFDAYLARALYTAIATDTGCFRYSNTNEHTFSSAAFLSSFAEEGDFYRINKAMFETKTPKEVRLEAFAAQEVEVTCGGRLAYLSVSLEKQKEMGAQYADLENLVNVIRQIQGVRVSIVAKEREEGIYKVSVRAEEGFDASEFCAHFGGGGHIAAAGCTVVGTEKEVLAALLSEGERRLG